jgi:hypothetical protein
VSKPVSPWHERKRAIRRSELPPSDRAVYLSLLDHASFVTAELRKRTPSLDVIAADTGVSRRQVVYSLHHLERHGWVKVTSGAGTRRNQYELAAGGLCDCTVGRCHRPRDHLSAVAPPVALPVVQPQPQSRSSDGDLPREHHAVGERVKSTPQETWFEGDDFPF